MSNLRSFRITILTLVITAILSGCFGDIKMPNVKEAKFNRDPQEVLSDLKQIHQFEDANIKWTASTFGDKSAHNLKVFLINGQNLPDDDSLLDDIGRTAMLEVLRSIENDTAYDNFVVYFVNAEKTNGMNKVKETPFTYSLSELSNEN